ncbi:MAG TPA: hypothetical protein VHD90_07745 [Phototrophicaceae bacterium]|nr:hypothetical protein [Phototrophicaceae bacterium]
MKLLALALLCLILSPAGSVLAQIDSAAPLPLDQVTTGRLSKGGASVTYHFIIPTDQDVVIEFSADHVVLPQVCTQMQITVQSSPLDECPNGGGGGGDGDPAVQQSLFFPTAGDAAVAETGEITLTRPDSFDGAATYTLIPHLITPQPLTLGKLSPNAPQPNSPVQSYTLHANSATPFTLEAEENAHGGAFLWAVYQPYTPNVITHDSTIFPLQYVDGAGAPPGSALEGLSLYYLGGDTFRVLVAANTDYSLYAAQFTIPTLDERQGLGLALSYRQPVKAVRLASSSDAMALDLAVTQGTGAFVWIYTQNQSYPDTHALGVSGDGSGQLPLTATLNYPASAFSRVVVVQLPADATRNAYTVTVRWEPQ